MARRLLLHKNMHKHAICANINTILLHSSAHKTRNTSELNNIYFWHAGCFKGKDKSTHPYLQKV